MGTRTISTYSYDVYGDAAGLTEYATGSSAFYATYAAATTDTVARAHVEATRLLTRLEYESTVGSDPATATGDLVTACYELTLAGLADPKVFTQASAGANIKSVTAKGAGVEFFAPVDGGRFPARVMELLTSLLAGASDYGAAYVSGTSTCSAFDEDDRYGVTGG